MNVGQGHVLDLKVTWLMNVGQGHVVDECRSRSRYGSRGHYDLDHYDLMEVFSRGVFSRGVFSRGAAEDARNVREGRKGPQFSGLGPSPNNGSQDVGAATDPESQIESLRRAGPGGRAASPPVSWRVRSTSFFSKTSPQPTCMHACMHAYAHT